jgi:NAD(P)-dependent dehydrogenase (short-subunit alcohol dehydrogenase family)
VEETARLVTAARGVGIAVAVDHRETDQVEALVQKVDAEQGRLDVLVNDIWGGENLIQWNTPLWSHDLEAGLRMVHLALDTHLITSHWASPLLIRRRGGLVVELRPFGCAAVALTPGWMRSEMMLEAFGVTEANWPEAAAVQPHFAAISESPRFVGRAAAALAADPGLMRRSGGSYSSGGLAHEFGFTDVDGSQPTAGATW